MSDSFRRLVDISEDLAIQYLKFSLNTVIGEDHVRADILVRLAQAGLSASPQELAYLIQNCREKLNIRRRILCEYAKYGQLIP